MIQISAEDTDEPGDVEAEKNPPGLKSSKSFYNHAQGAASHVADHKHKYSACCIFSSVGIIVGCILGLSAAVYYHYHNEPSRAAQLSASKGTTLHPVSPLPPKGSSAARRLTSAIEELMETVNHFSLRQRGPSVVDPKDFPELSDYSLMLDPTYVVEDASASAVNHINMISCFIDQLKVKDLLPFAKPYIAMVDTKLCGADDGVQSWSVTPSGPPGMGDGKYVTDAIFTSGAGNSGSSKAAKQSLGGLAAARMAKKDDGRRNLQVGGGSVTYCTMDNNIVDGELVTSKIYWNVGRYVSGALVVKYPVKNVTSEVSVEYIQKVGDWDDKPDYMKAVYDVDTSVGVASSRNKNSDSGAVTTYSLSFSNEAILRRSYNDNGVDQTMCLDFSADARQLVGDRYTIFDAGDGSEVTYETGFIIQRKVDEFSGPVQGYISNWGVWGFWVEGRDGTWVDGTPYIAEDGAVVEKVNYNGQNSEYTLDIVKARMTKITNHHVTLDELKGLPLVVQSPTSYMDELVIAWNGTAFEKLSTFSSRCVYYDRHNYWLTTPLEVDEDVVIDNYMDCGCLTNDGAARHSGIYTPYYNIVDKTFSSTWDYTQNDQTYLSVQTVEFSLDKPQYFSPTVSKYPYGLYVSSRSRMLNARVEFKFDQIQTMYGVRTQKYTRGTRVYQASSGAEGVVYATTKARITGFTCYNCITYTSKTYSKYDYRYTNGTYSQMCSPPQGYTSTGSYLMKGLKLTQGSAVGYTTDDWASVEWNGFGIQVESGTFSLNENITVSMSDKETGNMWYQDIVGTLSPPEISTLSWNWEDISVTDGECTGYPSFDVTVTGVTDAVVGVYYWDTYGFYAYVQSQGTDCVAPVVNVELSSFSSGSCTKLPVVKVKCSAQIREDSSSVLVSVTSAKKFVGSYYGGGPITYGDGESSISIGAPYWINDAVGEMKPIDGSTTLTFTTYTTINPGDKVPELLCYDNCPKANPDTWPSCSGSECKENKMPSHLSNRIDLNSGGSCVGKFEDLPVVSFANIKGSPSVNVTWDSSYDDTSKETSWYISFIALIDPGYDCSGSSILAPTITFVDENLICGSSVPTATVSCQSGNDVSDYRQAFHYDFDPLSGKLSDSDKHEAVILNNPHYSNTWSSESFGPFFENTDAAKSQLLCDYNEQEVCSWKAWSSLDEVYYYNTGPGSIRSSLVKNGASVTFGEPINLLYTHSGSDSSSGHDYDGVTTLLSYQGPGDLRGLPQFCLDPVTQKRADTCVPTGSVDSTLNMDDIVIPSDHVIHDLEGNSYYAKAQIMKEFYPVASDSSICTDLNFNNVPSPVNENMILDPRNLNDDYPSSDTLESRYLSGGKPVVVRGIISSEYVV